MDQTAKVQVQCKGCGKRYDWSEEVAGQQIRCDCGKALKYPVRVAAPSTTYALSEPRQAPAPVPELEPEAPKILEYQRGADAVPRIQKSRNLKDVYLPVGLFAVGFGLNVLFGFLVLASAQFMWNQFYYVFTRTAIPFAAMAIAGKIRGLHWGETGTAMYKLASIYIAPVALFLIPTLLMSSRVPYVGGVIFFLIRGGLFAGLAGYMFDLDKEDLTYWVTCFFIIGPMYTALAMLCGY
jgi:hypothetical protein